MKKHSRQFERHSSSHEPDNAAKTLKMAFWDRTISVPRWRQVVTGKRNNPEGQRIAAQSFKYLPVAWLLEEIGEDNFAQKWPTLRTALQDDDPIARQRKDAWDAIWGIMVAGDSQYPVSSEVPSLSKKSQYLFKTIVTGPGLSIYDLAKKAKRDYSRVYKDIQGMIDRGLIEVREGKTQQHRSVKRLYPAKSIHSRLVLEVPK